MDSAAREIIEHAATETPAPRGRRQFWTTREEQVLREHYGTDGPEACVALLPGRTLGALRNHARALGLNAPRQPAFRRKYPKPSPHMVALIREGYAAAKSSGDINRLAMRLGRPRWWVSRRAAELGIVVPRYKEPEWTEAEDELLGQYAQRSVGNIRGILKRHGYTRTETAIHVRLKRLRLGMRCDRDHYSAHQLGELLGVDGKTPTAWIARGLLEAGKRGTARTAAQGGDMWWISRAAVRRFIVANPELVDPRKADWLWLVSLLAGHGDRSGA